MNTMNHGLNRINVYIVEMHTKSLTIALALWHRAEDIFVSNFSVYNNIHTLETAGKNKGPLDMICANYTEYYHIPVVCKGIFKKFSKYGQ